MFFHDLTAYGPRRSWKEIGKTKRKTEPSLSLGSAWDKQRAGKREREREREIIRHQTRTASQKQQQRHKQERQQQQQQRQRQRQQRQYKQTNRTSKDKRTTGAGAKHKQIFRRDWPVVLWEHPVTVYNKKAFNPVTAQVSEQETDLHRECGLVECSRVVSATPQYTLTKRRRHKERHCDRRESC